MNGPGLVDVGDELLDMGVGGLEHDVLGTAFLHHRAIAEHGDAVADLQRLVEIVGDEQDRLVAVRLCSLSNSSCMSGADQRIERREGLVHQEDVGIEREGPGEADALLLAAGEVGAAGVSS